MADIQPFRGWRYDLSQVGDLSEVTAPPYDVIDARQQETLYKKHPCNVIRLELNREEPGDTSPEETYVRAAAFLHRWIHEGVLIQEREEALYVYHQEFLLEGRTCVRKGFMGRIRLEPFGKGTVFPHEQTLSGPRADRLKLTRACRMNLSPIFGLYADDDNEAFAVVDQKTLGLTPVEARDSLGVIHRLWPITDPQTITRVRELMRDKPIFIADGHHRYETACNYRDELAATREIDEQHPANFALMMFVSMSDPGLSILPTHRLVTHINDFTSEQIAGALQPHFEIEVMGQGASAAQQTWELIAASEEQTYLGLGTTIDNTWILAKLTDPEIMDQLVPDQSSDWKSLGVAVLHELVIKHLLKEMAPQFRYVHLLNEVIDSQKGGECQLACLVPPARMEHIELIASHLEKMPPKSTYFYPKLLTGMVFHSLE